jgi:hypothetical protein
MDWILAGASCYLKGKRLFGRLAGTCVSVLAVFSEQDQGAKRQSVICVLERVGKLWFLFHLRFGALYAQSYSWLLFIEESFP